MAHVGKLGLACALCLAMSLSLFTSGAFAQSTNQRAAGNTAQIVTAHTLQGASHALLLKNPHRWKYSCGAACGNGFSGCGYGFCHGRFIRVTRITKITRIIHITKVVRFERFRYRG